MDSENIAQMGRTPATLAHCIRSDLVRARPPRLRIPCGMTINGTLAGLCSSASAPTQRSYAARDAIAPSPVLAPLAFQPEMLQPWRSLRCHRCTSPSSLRSAMRDEVSRFVRLAFSYST